MKARAIIEGILQDLLNRRQAAPWFFRSPMVSHFGFSGNLLEGVLEVRTEYPFSTPFGKDFRFDIALLGPTLTKEPTLLGAVETEFTHEFDFLKCFLIKSLGFPLLSVDITEIEEEEVTPDWCRHALLGTTTSDSEGRRLNYIYLHDMLSPVYLDAPDDMFEGRHQYIVVVRDEQFEELQKRLEILKHRVGLKRNDVSVLVQVQNVHNEHTRKVQANEAGIAGRDWAQFNTKRYLRIVLDRPVGRRGPVYLYHLLMTRLINGHYDALVGYKFVPGQFNSEPDRPVWVTYDPASRSEVEVLPKQLGQPVQHIWRELTALSW